MEAMRKWVGQALGGRIVKTPFLDIETQHELSVLVRQAGLVIEFFPGLVGAARRAAVVFDAQTPSAPDPTQVIFLVLEGDTVGPLERKLRSMQSSGELGEWRPVTGGLLLAVLPSAIALLEGAGFNLQSVDAAMLQPVHEKQRIVVVPSLRVDVVGAKGFGVSRSYFVQGVKGAKVRLHGRVARPGDEVREGDELIAEGLGWLKLIKVLGETKRGNWKLELRSGY